MSPPAPRCFDNDLVQLPLRPGRVCDGGCCSGACSRVILPDFLSRDEAYSFRDQLDNVMVPIEEHPHHNLYLMSCAAAGNVRTTLSFVRIVEKLRRMIAHEYGLDLSSLAPKQTFVSRLSVNRPMRVTSRSTATSRRMAASTIPPSST